MATVRVRKRGKTYSYIFEAGKTAYGKRRVIEKGGFALKDDAYAAGVITNLDYGVFTNYGYMGLYGGMKAKDIHKKKGLQKSQNILDHMGIEELAANLFRATQTEAKLRRDNVQGKENANMTHYAVGKKVRIPSKTSAAPCPKIFRHQTRASNRLSASRKRNC